MLLKSLLGSAARAPSTMPPPPVSSARVVVALSDAQRSAELASLLREHRHDAIELEPNSELAITSLGVVPDLILLDANAEHSLLARLRLSTQAAPVPIVLAQCGAEGDAELAATLASGADDVVMLARPLELLARVGLQLKRRRDWEQLRRLRSERDRLRHDLRRDPLTGVFNRGSLDAIFERGRAGDRPFGVLFVDVDHFKRINDQHGHAVGDRALTEIAAILEANIGPDDVVGRYGGEEFLVLTDEAEPNALAALGERLRAAVEAGCVAEGALHLSVSIGGAVADPERGLSTNAVMSADVALYASKRAGRNRVTVHGARASGPVPRLAALSSVALP